jgi:hypothetical protein
MICLHCKKWFKRKLHGKSGVRIYCTQKCQRIAAKLRKIRPLTADRLKELLDYSPVDGRFRWRPINGMRGHRKGGQIAGWADELGYWHIRVDERLYLAHRLVWLYVYGRWPKDKIDHRDCIAGNDLLYNLREATQKQNCHNARIPKTNTSGFKGVSRKRNKWRAYIKVEEKQKTLGVFSTPEEAHEAYIKAATKYRGEFARAA